MSPPKYLGIEIGGTKLQLGVGTGETAQLAELVRADVDVEAGAEGILRHIEQIASALCGRHRVKSTGVGFGGPVNVISGQVYKSHQIKGWDNIHLRDRLRDSLRLPVHIDNDCNVAATGEASLGAGQGASRVFYVTVGTGIGGGFVVDGQLDGNRRPAISEIGHLRPGIGADSADDTVESISSGWGISNWARHQLATAKAEWPSADGLLEICGGDLEALTTKQIGAAAAQGNALARAALDRSTKTLGWAIAQVVTLLAPDVVVVGGGVSLVGDNFFEPLRKNVAAFVFPTLAGSYSVVPSALGEEVVIHGAIQITRNRSCD